jgi:hypothetical protein
VCSVGGVRARMKFVLCDLATISTIYLTHYMASTTSHGVPSEEGCVSSGRLSRVLWQAKMDKMHWLAADATTVVTLQLHRLGRCFGCLVK